MGGKLCAGRTQSQPLAQGPVCRGHRDPRGEASVINAAADRHHLLDLDHLRTDRACAGGRAAFAVAVVSRLIVLVRTKKTVWVGDAVASLSWFGSFWVSGRNRSIRAYYQPMRMIVRVIV